MTPNELLNATDQMRRHDLAKAKEKLRHVRGFLVEFKAMDPADGEPAPWIVEAMKTRDRLERRISEAKAADNHGMVQQLTLALDRLASTSQLLPQDKAPQHFINERHEELATQEKKLLATIDSLEEQIAASDAAWEAANAARLAAEADARLRQQFQAERKAREDQEFSLWKQQRTQTKQTGDKAA